MTFTRHLTQIKSNILANSYSSIYFAESSIINSLMNKFLKWGLSIIGILVLCSLLTIALLNILLEHYDYSLVSKKAGEPFYPEKSFLPTLPPLPPVDDRPIKNIILIIGDGMGINQIELARYRYYGITGRLNMERMPFLALVETKPISADLITDSAAGATALATGHKTRNKMIGMSSDSVARPSLLEALQQIGWKTGLITSSGITDATPASFAAHVPHRDLQHEIAIQMADHKVNFLAGATGGFEGVYPNQKYSIAKYAESLGYEVVKSKSALAAANDSLVLAFFDNIQQDPMYKDKAPQRDITLAEITSEALQRLDGSNGFLLMVEEEGTDTGGHINDINFLTEHLKQLDDAVKVALDFAIANGETLVIVTADHETGGLTFPKGNMRSSIDIHWSTAGHTGAPVPLYAYGPHASKFSGKLKNTDLVKIIGKLLDLKEFNQE